MRASSFFEKELDQYLEDLLEHLLQRALYLVRVQCSKELRAQTLTTMNFDCQTAYSSERVKIFLASPVNDRSSISDKILTRISRIHAIGALCFEAMNNKDEGNLAMQLSVLAEVIKKTILNFQDMEAPLSSESSEGIQTH